MTLYLIQINEVLLSPKRAFMPRGNLLLSPYRPAW